MKDTKRIIISTAIIIIVFALIIGLSGCGFNKQIIDLDYKYTTAIILYPNDEAKTYEIRSWTDFENSDSIQISTIDGKVIYTHLSNVILIGEK